MRNTNRGFAATWLGWTGLAIAGVIALGAGIGIYGALRWQRASAGLLERLESARRIASPGHYDSGRLDGLPAPVQRYLRKVLVEGQPLIAAVNMRHEGRFNLDPNGENWKPFRSRQRVVTGRPGFVWDAEVMMMPGLPVRVHDAYVAGAGQLEAALAGALTVAATRSGKALDEGELMRYLAEAAWYPTALLPGEGLRWEAVDAHSARATLTDGPLSVTLLFRFGGDDLIESVSADARGRTVGRTIVMTPWEGRWSGYARQDGMLVPMHGEVAWLTPAGRLPYWRGTVLALEYEPAPQP